MMSRAYFKYWLLILLLAFSKAASAEKILDLKQLPLDLQQRIFTQLPNLQSPDFRQSDLDQLIRFLISEQFFDYAALTLETLNSTETYHLVASKNRRISALEYRGLTFFPESVLRQEFAIGEKSPFDQNTLIEAGERLRQFYRVRGFPKTTIDLEFRNINSVDTVVVVQIHEGVQTKISEIKVKAANSDFQTNANSFLKSKIGEPLTEATLAEIRSESRVVFSKKRYLKAALQNPQITLSPDESQAKLEFLVDRPEKYEVFISGYQELGRSEIDRTLDLDHFFSTNPTIGPELSSKIRAYYLAKGFSRAEVLSDETDTEKLLGKRITIKITEGPQVKISQLEVTGRLSLPPSNYSDFLRRHSSELILDGYYNRDDLDSGLNNLKIDRQNQGFLKARVVSTRATYNREKDKINFVANLDEGPLTLLQDLGFDGLLAFSSEQLLPLTGLQVGDALRLNLLEGSVQKIKEFYYAQGFLEMTLLNEKQDLVTYNEDSTAAKVLYRINEGPKIVVGSIVVEGNSLTKDYVVLKELEFAPGDTLSPQKIEESKARLQKLGHFSSIDIKTLEEKTSISLRTVIVKVTDRDPGLFNFGAGVNNERTLTVRGYTGLAYRNIGGTGRGVSGRIDANYNVADFKYLESKLTLGYLEPYIFDSRMRGRLNVTRSRQVSNYQAKTVSEVNQQTWSVEQDLTSNVLLSYDIFNLATVKDYHRDGREDEFPTTSQDIASTGPNLDIDFRDHPFNPSKGTFTRLNIEYASPWLGSTNTIEYIKYYASFSHYLPVSQSGWVLANNLRGGYLKNLSSSGSVPYDKKGFTLGGQSTIRSFESSDGFPGFPYEFSKSQYPNLSYPLKTDSTMYLLKSELRFPIFGSFGGAFFYDGGAVLIGGVDLDDPYRDALGLALRYTTPVGAVSLEWGWKLDRKESRSERPIAFHFSIGTF